MNYNYYNDDLHKDYPLLLLSEKHGFRYQEKNHSPKYQVNFLKNIACELVEIVTGNIYLFSKKEQRWIRLPDNPYKSSISNLFKKGFIEISPDRKRLIVITEAGSKYLKEQATRWEKG